MSEENNSNVELAVARIEVNLTNQMNLLNEVREMMQVNSSITPSRCEFQDGRISRLEKFHNRLIGALIVIQVEAATFFGMLLMHIRI